MNLLRITYLQLIAAGFLPIHPMNHAALARDEFKVMLFFRCNLPFPNLLSKCDRCSQPCAVEHALRCKKGGLMTACDDHLKLELANLFRDALPQSHVKIEPILPYSLDKNDANGLVDNVSVRNIWNDDKISIFNIQLTYPFCKSNTNSDPGTLLKSKEKKKKAKHVKRCREHKLNFTPCAASINLIIGDEFKRLTKNIAERLEKK